MIGINWLDPKRRQADAIRIMMQVHRGALTPEGAEEWAKANGRPPFVPAIGAAPNLMEKSAWPIPLAAAWILTREPVEALNAWQAYKVWGRALCRDNRMYQAQTELWHQLSCGEAHATGVKPGTEERVAIPAVEWNDFTWMRIGDAAIISFHGSRRPVYLDILVEARDIYALWPKPKPSAVKAAAATAEEGRCRAALVLRMRAAPTTPVPKSLFRGEFPQLRRRAFERAYAAAAEKANAPAWRAPGRRKKRAPEIATPD